jgi:hypothetical protein
MIDEETKQVVRTALSSDARPWWSLSGFESAYIEIEFPESAAGEAQAVAEAARDLGFAATEGEPLAKSLGGVAHKAISLFIEYGPHILNFASNVKTMLEIPDTVRKLRNKIAPYLGKADKFAPQLQLPLLVGWLDRAYGPENWKVDPLLVQLQIIGKVMVFVVPESTSGRRHVLVAHGDEIEEFPGDLLPKK